MRFSHLKVCKKETVLQMVYDEIESGTIYMTTILECINFCLHKIKKYAHAAISITVHTDQWHQPKIFT